MSLAMTHNPHCSETNETSYDVNDETYPVCNSFEALESRKLLLTRHTTWANNNKESTQVSLLSVDTFLHCSSTLRANYARRLEGFHWSKDTQ